MSTLEDEFKSLLTHYVHVFALREYVNQQWYLKVGRCVNNQVSTPKGGSDAKMVSHLGVQNR